ncbi:MAG: preprotein translocase subunit SecA [Deltaproteobacteria bacterium]|nr:preprotein translocase subunit SecA [Deltaproteobacteria bacterium]MCL5792708.1 preprotein translocase subunit SecA [Deltaproteobacteria bacterium]
MFDFVFKKILGTQNERDLKMVEPIVDSINKLEPSISVLSDNELRAKTDEFKKRLENGETIEDLLIEAFAVVREASKRTLRMRHFDVQLIGGIILHKGRIAEMKTGEGKTLVATLPAYLNALDGRGVHIITVNDYLAKRDSEWMGEIYSFLGLSVGVVVHELDDKERQAAYNSDITYGTNNEFGFDYLRDNMKFDINEMVQKELNYAIVDEVDSILIDEARTPLIISGPAEESTSKYYTIDKIIPKLKKDADYTVDEKYKQVILTEEGAVKVEQLLSIKNLFEPSQIEILHHVNQALKAHVIFKKDVDYMIKDGEVVIVDEFTGRLMPGRRWSDGLHQAIEAKEGVKIENENQTLATVTFQNYFRMYKKLAGMTGTADTEASEFKKIYNLDVNIIPTNLEMIRLDQEDSIYGTEEEKFNAVIEEILKLNKAGTPVLVGTISIEKSETLSKMLTKRGVKHHVLNAKHHEKEAGIIAQAGRKGSVTIATNMAGRGVDILLGGNPEYIVKEKIKKGDAKQEDFQQLYETAKRICDEEKEVVLNSGGLHIIGTERHEARRIDNQLRGRSGRQGDPGASRFYLSLQDDLLRRFGSERISSFMQKSMGQGEPITHPWLTKAIASAQKKVEEHNFEIRKHLLEYDDVMNKQREVIYEMRKEILKGEKLESLINDMIEETIDDILHKYIEDPDRPEEWDFTVIDNALDSMLSIKPDFAEDKKKEITAYELKDMLLKQAGARVEEQQQLMSKETFSEVTKFLFLQVVDSNWKDFLLNMDHLKEGVGLRGYAQKDPLVEYKKEAFDMFQKMLVTIREESVSRLFKIHLKEEEPHVPLRKMAPLSLNLNLTQPSQQAAAASVSPGVTAPIKREKKVGRNDPCWCGSGKKYKNCHGKTA